MAQAATPSPVIAPVSTAYRRYALWVLLIIYTLNFLDRQVVNILAEPIKRDLGLADWQLGMMTGLAFAIFYTVLGIPIARIAETKNRPHIIGISVAAWSAFTVLCGFTQNFWQLILARIGVGVGEAGCTPPAHSLITDYVPKEKRASAIAFYSIGTPLGTLAGMAMGGLVADAYGWRVAFMVAGAPGLVFALVAAFTLVEPRKKLAAEMAARASSQISFAAALAVLATKKTFWLVALAAGLALGLIGGTAGVIGAWLGGVFADRLGAKDLRAYVTVPAIASVITIPIFVVAMSLDAPMAAISLLAINALLGTLWYGPVYATAQSIVDPALRATASAVLLLIINLIGLGLGPLVVGLLSDILAGPVGLGEAQGVRWALILSATLGLVAFALFWAARKTIRDEMVS
ncbi:MAG: MFS transporter [Caulobacter vibrioides]|uniref:MFS transporter n=1 Tax=Caulobacter vibrioides TaxID=155892 RepID=A0A258CTW9_CAUVI|nr:MAG: MFS transporter [Caulobacter vibrioides]